MKEVVGGGESASIGNAWFCNVKGITGTTRTKKDSIDYKLNKKKMIYQY